MKRTAWISCGMLLLIILFFITSAHAHKVRVFAYNEGNTIITESVFSGGRAAQNSEIIVRDAVDGSVILTGRTDDKGLFRFTIPDKVQIGKPDLKIIVNAGEGHRGEWLLTAEEYLEEEIKSDPTGEMEQAAGKKSAEIVSMPEITTQVVTIDEQLLRRVVGEELDKKFTPIKRMLIESREQKPTLPNILGGIGYLLGLAGMAAYFKSRKNSSRSKHK